MWEGKWTRTGDISFDGAEIRISFFTGSSLWFSMDAYSGSHVGSVEGIAAVDGKRAIFADSEGAEMKITLNKDRLLIEQNDKMYYYAGSAVGFDGEFKKGEVEKKACTLKDCGIVRNDKQEQLFREMTGEHYEKFLGTLQLVTEGEDLDGYGIKVYVSAVRGMFTMMESIIMVGPGNSFRAAVIEDDEVYYFTNAEGGKTLPKTIEDWRERFSELKVIMQ